MMQQLAKYIVDSDPMTTLRRTADTVRYIQNEWSKTHDEPIDGGALRLFLCDERYGDLTDEQKAVARRCRDEMRSIYEEMYLRSLQCVIMLEKGMVSDMKIYRSIFFPQGGDAPWLCDKAG